MASLLSLTCILAAISACCFVQLSHADTVVEVNFIRFTEKHHSYGPGESCCESFNRDTCESCCPEPCKHYFKLCVTDLANRQDHCIETVILTPNKNLTRLNADVVNPWIVELDTTAYEGFSFQAEVHDKNFWSDVLLYKAQPKIIKATPSPSVEQAKDVIVHSHRKTNTSDGEYLFHFRVYCKPNYYNESCEVYCLAQNDISGRYECNKTTGQKICSDGWSGENCNFGMDMPQLTLPFTNATQFRAGSSVTLQCQVTTSNPPPIYYLWWYNTKELIANTTSNMLTVRNLTTNNSGAYQCEAVNSYIRRRIQHMLTIFVWVMDTPLIMSPQSFIQYGENLTLNCSYRGNLQQGDEIYRWFDDSREIIRPNVSRQDALKLVLSGSDRNRAYSIRCQVTKYNIAVTSETGSFRVSWLTEPKLQIVTTNSSITGNCISLGFPKPTHEWYINGSLVDETDSSQIWLPKSMLKSGNFLLGCTSRNVFGTRSAKDVLIRFENREESKPNSIKCKDVTKALPRNTRILNPVGEYEDEDRILFTCSAGFYPSGTNLVMSSVCRKGSLVNEFPNEECLTDYCLSNPCGDKKGLQCTNTKTGPKCQCADDGGQRMTMKDDGTCVASQFQEVKDEKEAFEVATIILAVLIVLMLLLVVFLCCCFKRKVAERQRKYEHQNNEEATTPPVHFTNNAYTFETNEMKERKPNGDSGNSSPPPEYEEPK